jgi:hypothetical protein
VVIKGNRKHFAALDHVPSCRLQGRNCAVGVIDHEMQETKAFMGKGRRCHDVNVSLAEQLTNCCDHPRSVLGLNDNLSRHDSTLDGLKKPLSRSLAVLTDGGHLGGLRTSTCWPIN